MVIFLDSFEGKSKDKGTPFQIVTLMEVRRNKKDNRIKARMVEFFVDGLDCTGFEAGDIVKPEFEESEFLGGKPELVGLESKGANVFTDEL